MTQRLASSVAAQSEIALSSDGSGASAVMALFSGQIEKLKADGKVPDEDLTTKMDEVRAEYDRQLDARFAAARGFVDEVVLPEEVRPALGLLLRAAMHNDGPHIGAFQIGGSRPAAFSTTAAPDGGLRDG